MSLYKHSKRMLTNYKDPFVSLMLHGRGRRARRVPTLSTFMLEGFIVVEGNTGYVTLYRYEADIITILAVRHQKEAGF